MEPLHTHWEPHRNAASRFQIFSSPSRDTFQLPVTLLYAIGFEKCLDLDDGVTQILYAISSADTRDTPSALPNFTYGTITLYRLAFQPIRLFGVGFNRGPTTPHLHILVAYGFGLVYTVFVRH